MDVPLFERLGRRVTLTDAGRELPPRVQQMVHQAVRAREAVQGAGSDPRAMRGPLSIAAPLSAHGTRLCPTRRHGPLS
nr:hypothetical protein [Streptomyces antioxidans]